MGLVGRLDVNVEYYRFYVGSSLCVLGQDKSPCIYNCAQGA